jgi:Tat protein secretion system quality control protein TatD with DNase activity
MPRRPSQSCYNRPRNGSGDGLHSRKIAIGCDGETGLDYVHAEPIKLARQTRLFAYIHAAAGGLFAVA